MRELYRPEGFLLNGSILEYRALGNIRPVDFVKTGLILSTLKTVWLFPFKKRNVPLNIKPVIPNKTIGLITSREEYTNIEVTTKIIDETFDCLDNPVYVKVKSTSLFPKRLKEQTQIAILTIIPYVELQCVENRE